MKSVCSKFFSLGDHRSVVLGLEMTPNLGHFISLLSLVSETGERVLFTVYEVNQFFKWFPAIQDFFNKNKSSVGVRELSVNLELLFTSEKVVVIRSKLNWNTMRLKRQNFENLVSLKELISEKIERLETKRLRADIIFDTLVQTGASYVLNNGASQHDQPKEPQVKELLNICKYGAEKLQRVVIVIYQNELLACIQSRVYTLKPNTFPEGS